MADDFDLAQLRQQARRLAVRIAQQRCGVNFRHIERRQLVSLLARRRLLEDQAFVLRLVGTDFAERARAVRFRDSLPLFYASTSPAASTFAAVSIVLARHHFRRAPERCVAQFRIPAAQIDAADNLVVEQPLGSTAPETPRSATQIRESAARH